MNWIIYATFLLSKLAIIAGLVFLSMLTVPVILFILCLGMLLAYVRDVEPTVDVHKIYVSKLTFSFFTLGNVRSLYFALFSQIISYFPHVSWPRNPRIRNKSIF